MPTAMLPAELEALIEQNITDELDQQNTAQRVREVLLYMVASMGLPTNPGTPINPDYAALMQELAKKADKTVVSTALAQKEPLFKAFAQSELKAVEYAYSNLLLRPLLKQLISAVAAGGGGGGSSAPFDITPAVSDGDIQAGITYKGVTSEDLWRLKLEPYAKPGFNAFTIAGQGSQTVEVGTQFAAGFKSVAWGTANSGNVTANSIRLQDLTANATLADNEANDGTLSASTASFTAVDGESRRYRLSGLNSNNARFSADLVIVGSRALFFGPTNAAPTTSAAARGLAQSQLVAQGNTGILSTGTTALKMAIVLPPGRTLQNVTDLDNQGLNLTSKYVAQPTISVNNASGTPVPGYTPYVLSIATPYTASARHQFTYA